eukprot:6214346-Pleurochrysis_carterae.AAC.3
MVVLCTALSLCYMLLTGIEGAAILPPVHRSFAFVPYGQSADTCSAAISCDGKVACPSASPLLELSHWTDNTTPDDLYADTSTECALRLADARQRGLFTAFDNALVLNNHYDTDGVLSVWTCLDPERARTHAGLLAEAAAAGDFGEWSSEQGIKLDAAIESIADAYPEDADAYAAALDALPAMLDDFAATGGDGSEALWRDAWARACEDWDDLSHGRSKLTVDGAVAVLHEPADRRITAPALQRKLAETEGGAQCTRVLRVSVAGEGSEGLARYELEKPGHGWVQRLVTRMPIPGASGSALAADLSDALGCEWQKGGKGGLVAVCYTKQLVGVGVDEVVRALRECDPGAR